jgi:hypothetical protein
VPVLSPWQPPRLSMPFSLCSNEPLLVSVSQTETVASCHVAPLKLIFLFVADSMACFAEPQSRQNFLAQAAALTGTLLLTPNAALAAKYGGLGRGSPEVLDPKEAEVDEDILKSDAVQKALGEIKGYKETVMKMQAAVASDSQANLRPSIIKDLDAAKLRQTLNTVNTAFEEDTQRGTDRLIRVILQDITELEVSNAQKDGIPRSPRRLETICGKLTKLDKAFGDLLLFAK